MFDIKVLSREKVFVKKHGFCKGLKCIDRGDYLDCSIPENCIDYAKLTGIEKKYLVDKLTNYLNRFNLKTDFINKFSFIYSTEDKLYVFLSIYLSRNTDYYRNTIKWVRVIIENNCLEHPYKCLNLINSYQYRELTNIVKKNCLVEKLNYGDVKILTDLKGVGLKTINAYLLHTYGHTEYAPIDRHYYSFLKSIGVEGVVPSKTQCIRSMFSCLKCSARSKCLYNNTYYRFGFLNGIIQSMNYVYSRLKRIIDHRVKLSKVEEKLLSNVYEYSVFIDEFEKLIDILTSVNKLNIE